MLRKGTEGCPDWCCGCPAEYLDFQKNQEIKKRKPEKNEKQQQKRNQKQNIETKKIINTTTSEAPDARNIRGLAWVLSVIRQACAMVCQTA